SMTSTLSLHDALPISKAAVIACGSLPTETLLELPPGSTLTTPPFVGATAQTAPNATVSAVTPIAPGNVRSTFPLSGSMREIVPRSEEHTSELQSRFDL